MSRTFILALAIFAIVLSSVDAHAGHSKRGQGMPYGWRAKRDTVASSCSYMQCAVSGGNCGASGSGLTFCPAGEHCDGSKCTANKDLGASCSPQAFENECKQGTCVDLNDGNGATCRIYQEVMPGNPCSADTECYFNQNADGTGSAASTCDATTKTCFGRKVSEQCTATHQCLVGLFCSAGSCQPLGVSGSSCSAESDCSSRFTCLEGKCASRYTRTSGQTCATTENCAAGLYCKAGTCAAAKTMTATGAKCDISGSSCAADEQCACQGFTSSNQQATCSNIKGTYASMDKIEQQAYSCMDKNGCGSDTNNATTISCISSKCLTEYCTYFTRSSNDLFTQFPSCLVSRMVESNDFNSLINTCQKFAPSTNPSSTTGEQNSASAIAGSLVLVAAAAVLAF